MTSHLKEVRANQPHVTLREAQEQAARIMLAQEAAGQHLPTKKWRIHWKKKDAPFTDAAPIDIDAITAVHTTLKFNQQHPDKDAVYIDDVPA